MALTKTITSGTGRHGRQRLKSRASAEGEKWHVEPEYFYILLSEMRIYLDRSVWDNRWLNISFLDIFQCILFIF